MIEMPVLGEPLAVELANTVVRGDDGETRDLLRTRDDVRRWLAAHHDELPDGAPDAPPSVGQARRLRRAVRTLLLGALESERPEARALEVVNAASKAYPSRPVLEWPLDGEPRIVNPVPQAQIPRATLASIARSAIELLGGPDASRLRRCERHDCVLLFVASNPRRRWCSTAVCGNRVRVARHYQRHRQR
jgi:predicted RNA-binding Zn ribbon-like protein